MSGLMLVIKGLEAVSLISCLSFGCTMGWCRKKAYLQTTEEENLWVNNYPVYCSFVVAQNRPTPWIYPESGLSPLYADLTGAGCVPSRHQHGSSSAICSITPDKQADHPYVMHTKGLRLKENTLSKALCWNWNTNVLALKLIDHHNFQKNCDSQE